MYESILFEMTRNELAFRENEDKLMQQFQFVVESFENITDDWTLDRLQQFNLHTKEVIEGIISLLDMINNRLQAELSESARGNLVRKQDTYLKGVETLNIIQGVFEDVIKSNQPDGNHTNTQDVERQYEKLQKHQKELQNKLKEERKLVIDLRQQIQEQSNNKRCVVCLNEEANIVFIPCGHVCTCSSCSSQLQDKCPMCRQDFTSRVRVYN